MGESACACYACLSLIFACWGATSSTLVRASIATVADVYYMCVCASCYAFCVCVVTSRNERHDKADTLNCDVAPKRRATFHATDTQRVADARDDTVFGIYTTATITYLPNLLRLHTTRSQRNGAVTKHRIRVLHKRRSQRREPTKPRRHNSQTSHTGCR